MTHQNDSALLNSILQQLNDAGLDALLGGFATLLNEAMLRRRSEALGALPYERTDSRKGHANGFKPKTVETRMGPLELAVPQVRGDLQFYPSALDKGLRSEQALKLALAEMYVQGVSTRKVKAITEQLCGAAISSSHVSRAAKELDEGLQAWRERPLGTYLYLYLDARYEKVRQDGQVQDAAVLIAVGVSPDGKRDILGASVALSEQEVHWRSFLQSLVQRGLQGVRLIISDAHTGLRAACRSVFGGVPWQRCQFHLQQNAQAYVSRRSMQGEVAEDLRTIFNAPDRATADDWLARTVKKYEPTASHLATWMETNIPEGLTVFHFPQSHRRRIRTANLLERLNQEVKRRTRVVRVFPNEASCLRLVSAILMEKSEAWLTGRTYLNFEGSEMIMPSPPS